MEVYTILSFYTVCEVASYNLKAGSDKLKMYTTNPKAIIKVTNERVTVYKPTKKVKWNHQDILLIKRKAEKRTKEWIK